MENKVTKNMLVGEILRLDKNIAPILMNVGMHCLGCPSSQMESLEDACHVHSVNVDTIVEQINSFLAGKQE